MVAHVSTHARVARSVYPPPPLSRQDCDLLETALSKAVLEERNSLARELHDGVTQTLYSGKLISEALLEVVQQDPREAEIQAQMLHQLIDSALAELRSVLFELHTPSLTERELPDLIEQLVTAARCRTAAQLELRIEGCSRRIPPEVQLNLYRIVQGALSNAIRHAKARVITVRARVETGEILLGIMDDGIGFDPDDVCPGHLGLVFIRDRARAIGATVEIATGSGQGTAISVIWREECHEEGLR